MYDYGIIALWHYFPVYLSPVMAYNSNFWITSINDMLVSHLFTLHVPVIIMSFSHNFFIVSFMILIHISIANQIHCEQIKK